MKNVFFLILAIVLFAVAYYIYWIVAQESGAPTANSTRSLGPRAGGSELAMLLRQWQPYLSFASSVGGILSFLFQLRIWMRSRQ